ncbi:MULTISPECIES: hypothetical protein [Chryseobacterium]|jgi:hypothetical protein|uniref:Uncharacterized protein n=1 Tax=Chryseobacterium geocarposphaerae TaxID=1416776 RepID=A0ABU1LCT2_9FLAO|nr:MULTISPECIES: hypothetical protein [Chryseobacterium]MDR6404536.1 hypothetical protein [Chryseobacterium geocarposphaerae]MDR6698232.1 hypothetical protein [Chryseobacterium ginsenosidimutans]
MMKNIQIPEPCSENWDMMSPQEKGRFCSVCSKCVIDFTEKQPQEIQEIIEEKKDERICGRFYDHQLNKIEKSEQLKNKFFKYIPSNFQNNRVTLTVFSLILFLTDCSKQKEEACTTTTGVVMTDMELDTLNKNFVMGEPLMQNDSIAKMPEKDSLKSKSKK